MAGERRAPTRPSRLQLWIAVVIAGSALAAIAALAISWGDILQALLDPEVPYAVYRPPPAPDYRHASSWALLPGPPTGDSLPADVFFIHPTTFDGGRNWNGPVDDRAAQRVLTRTMLPNYAAPYASIGQVFAPRYRQASLYTSLTLFDDAIDAREFAYGDIQTAFRSFLSRRSPQRPFILVGVEQGGTLAARLLADEIAPRPDLRDHLVAAYLLETVMPDSQTGREKIPPCGRRRQTGCLVAWISAPWLDFGRVRRIMTRSLAWAPNGHLVGLGGRRPVCVNPLLGAASEADAPPRLALGAANATDLEWGARPGFMARQVGARCVAGILRVTAPRSTSLRARGGWATRLRAAPFNLFWADLEADASGRLIAWRQEERPVKGSVSLPR